VVVRVQGGGPRVQGSRPGVVGSPWPGIIHPAEERANGAEPRYLRRGPHVAGGRDARDRQSERFRRAARHPPEPRRATGLRPRGDLESLRVGADGLIVIHVLQPVAAQLVWDRVPHKQDSVPKGARLEFGLAQGELGSSRACWPMPLLGRRSRRVSAERQLCIGSAGASAVPKGLVRRGSVTTAGRRCQGVFNRLRGSPSGPALGVVLLQ